MRKVGVIGLGNRAFIMSYFKDIEGWEVAAAADVRQSSCDAFKEKYPDVPIDAFGPFEAPVYRVENKYRMRMVVKCRLNKKSRALFAELLAFFSRSAIRGLTLSADFNPSNI